MVGSPCTSSEDILTDHFDASFRQVYEGELGPVGSAIVDAPEEAVLVFNEAWFAAHMSGAQHDRYVLAASTRVHLERSLEFARSRSLDVIIVTSGQAMHGFDGELAGERVLRRAPRTVVRYIPRSHLDSVIERLR